MVLLATVAYTHFSWSLASIMKSYYVNINSNSRAILIALIFYGLSLFILLNLIPENWPDFISFLVTVALFVFPIIPATILSRGKIRIELTEDSFRAVWIKRFFLSNQPDTELSWDRVINYVKQEDHDAIDSFQLALADNQQFKFYRYSYFPQKDDFNNFLYYFPLFLQRVDLANERTIKRGKTEYQTRSFKWILIGLTVLSVGLLINALINPDSGTRWASFAIIFSGLIFYWQQATRKN